MIYHVMPGDAVAAEFRKTGIAGEIIVCRECLVVGPVDAHDPDRFWDERAHFILAEYGEDEIEFQERVADELERLRDIGTNDEVNLWFEYELFCQINMWFCLSLLKGTDAAAYRVAPVVRTADEVWKGFGALPAEDLVRCFDERFVFSASDQKLGVDLWQAFSKGDNDLLISLGATNSPCFPYLAEVCRAAAERETLPAQILSEIVNSGTTDPAEMFVEFTRRAGVYGYGDLQVERLLDRI